MTFIDCVIDITTVTRNSHCISSTNVSFANCKFVGKIENIYCPLFEMWQGYDSSSDNIKVFNVNFIDCEFNLENDWNKKEENGKAVDDPEKLFMKIYDFEYAKVNINFIRCYPGENEVNKKLKLINLADEEHKGNVKVIGEDNGLSVQWTWVKDSQQFGSVSEWSVIVNDTGYYPTQSPTEIEEDTTSGYLHIEEEENKKDNSKTWKITTIVFAVAFVVAIIVFIIVLIIIKKKKYDRSENE